MNYCQQHNKEMVYKEWTAKSGKKAGQICKAWKCPEPNCSEIIWVDSPKQAVYSPKPTQETASQMEAMRKLYALCLAIAHLNGVQQVDIDAELERMNLPK